MELIAVAYPKLISFEPVSILPQISGETGIKTWFKKNWCQNIGGKEMATYGYSRVSTRGQAKDGNSLESQNKLLKENGAEKIFSDCFTGTKLDRPEFDKLLAILKPGDKLIVTKLDRFARTARQGMELISSLLEKKVAVHVLNMGLIDDTPTGKLITQVLLAFSEFCLSMSILAISASCCLLILNILAS